MLLDRVLPVFFTVLLIGLASISVPTNAPAYAVDANTLSSSGTTELSSPITNGTQGTDALSTSSSSNGSETATPGTTLSSEESTGTNEATSSSTTTAPSTLNQTTNQTVSSNPSGTTSAKSTSANTTNSATTLKSLTTLSLDVPITASAAITYVPTESSMTFREYVIGLLNFKYNTKLSSTASAEDLKAAITANSSELLLVQSPQNVTSIQGLREVWLDMGSQPSTVTFQYSFFTWDEITTELGSSDFIEEKKLSFLPAIWDLSTQLATKGLIVDSNMSENQRVVPNNSNIVKQTDPLNFIDAFPKTVQLSVPVNLRDNTDFTDRMAKYFGDNREGYYDPTCFTIQRDNRSIQLTWNEATNDISWLTDDIVIGSKYSTKITAAIGADGNLPSVTDIHWYFESTLHSHYSVSVEPITAGSLNGTPSISGVDATTPTASYPTTATDPYQHTIQNTTGADGNINRGTNSATDSIGSNSAGADIRGGTYTAGTGTDPDKIAVNKLHTSGGSTTGIAGVNGTRTTGFTQLNSTQVKVDGQADTKNGFEVASYTVQVFDPITCELVESKTQTFSDTVNEKGTVTTSATDKVNTWLASGIQGKTKVYVSYRQKPQFTKVDINGKAITSSATTFDLYGGVNGATKLGTITSDSQGVVTLPSLECPTEAQNVNTYYLKETAAPTGYILDDTRYTITVDKDGNVTYPAEIPWSTTTSGTTFINELAPNPSYTISKVRVTDAPNKNNADNAYGFNHGDTVTYQATIANTGNIDLTMNALDAFEKADYFTTPQATKVTGDGVTCSTVLPTSSEIALSIPKGKTAYVTYTAQVRDSAVESLDTTAADAKDGDGYKNTVTVSGVTGTYTFRGKTVTIDKTTYKELKDMSDDAYTPVQTPTTNPPTTPPTTPTDPPTTPNTPDTPDTPTSDTPQSPTTTVASSTTPSSSAAALSAQTGDIIPLLCMLLIGCAFVCGSGALYLKHRHDKHMPR
ncbi:MAG: prealbumin-like fold domain-containing protein [Eggerthellaceae bacterium]|nr:prealbumin-like fold domain-containing protein [Eggerthellaceae bacterium]